MPECVMLLDGNSLINRAYYGLNNRNPLTAPDGTPTGAVYAFLNMYLRYLDELKPDYACIAFDRKEATFRHTLYEGYKSDRKPMPDDLAVQIPILKEIVRRIGLPQIELSGYEADDLLGTMARMSRQAGNRVCLVTGDKDSFQLIDDVTTVYQPLTKAGQSSTVRVDARSIMERYQVDPHQLIDIKALMGDPSDRIPGVRGIGEKGAIALVSRFHSLDKIYLNLDQIAPGVSAKLKDDKEMAYLSYRLSKIDCFVPIEESLNDWKLRQPDKAGLRELFEQYGFKSLLDKFDLMTAPSETKAGDTSPAPAAPDLQWFDDEKHFHDQILLFTADQRIAQQSSNEPEWIVVERFQEDCCLLFWRRRVACLTTGQLEALCIQLIESGCADPENGFQVATSYQERTQPVFQLVVWDYKQLLRSLDRQPLPVLPLDIMTAGYLLNQIDGKPDFARLFQTVTGEVWQEMSGQPIQQLDLIQASKETVDASRKIEHASELTGISQSAPARETVEKMCAILRVVRKQWQLLAVQPSIQWLLRELEMPLTGILSEMERIGFCLDQDELARLSRKMREDIEQLRLQITTLCDEDFNLNSPKQLGQILYDKLGLPAGKKRSGGNYSTDAEELERLRPLHPAIALIIEHRMLSKLNSTFLEGLKRAVHPLDGRVHTSFSQVQTATGRLSSSDPNLQNIPIRGEAGLQIRRIFIAPDGFMLLDADYSQIELRLLAHLSGDPAMLEAFNENQDIHLNTACSIFDLPAETITPDQRAVAKTVNFSIVYGISDFGLARDLGVSVKTAHSYIQGYDSKYPVVRKYLDSLKKSAYEKGYAETMFGRRRYLPELKSSNRNVRQFGERAAMNAPIQGSAADLIKMAMVRADRALKQEQLHSRIILQVHDELVLEVPVAETDRTAALLQDSMENVASLQVRLQAEVHKGTNWAECK